MKNTYMFKKMWANCFLNFVDLESKCDNIKSVDLYWKKNTEFYAIVKLHDLNEFLFTFECYNIKSARNLKCRLFRLLCENNTNYSVNLK